MEWHKTENLYGEDDQKVNHKKTLVDAMKNLMRIRSFETITVQMILDEASVSRSTFYRYFKDKYDLVNQYYQMYVKEILYSGACKEWKDYLRLVHQFMYDNKEYFIKAFGIATTDENSFWNFLYTYSCDYTKQAYKKAHQLDTLSEKEDLDIEAYVVGQIHISQVWLRRGAVSSVEEMTEWAYEITPAHHRAYLNQVYVYEFDK